MPIPEGMLVTIDYTLKDGKGNTLESSVNRGKVTFKMGDKRFLPGLADVIAELGVGQGDSGTFAPGKLIPADMIPARHVPATEFPDGELPKVGSRFEATGPHGRPIEFEVIDRAEKTVTARMIHPLADQPIEYAVTVVDIRRPGTPPPPPASAVPDMTDDLLED